MNPMHKRVCLLTGAGGRLGNAFCRLHSEKYRIAAVYRNEPPKVCSQHQRFVDPLNPRMNLSENDDPVFAIQADLTSDSELRRVVELVLARYGRIDLLINAAVYSIWAPLIEGDRLLKTASTQFEVNVVTPLKLAVVVAREFWRDRDQQNIWSNRNVVNVSSLAGLRIYRGLGQSVYSASKAALNHITRHMSHEFRPFGIRVNATAPDSFPQIIPTRRVVQSILRLDKGRMTGKLLVLDENGERLI